MDNQIQPQNPSQSPLPPENMRTKKKVWLIAIAVAILVILIGAWFIWNNYLSPEAQLQSSIY